MKTMKKLVAALLVLTMVLAMTGVSAMAACKKGAYVKFIKNAYAYTDAKSSKKTSICVRKGSFAYCLDTKKGYALVMLTPAYDDEAEEALGKLGNKCVDLEYEEEIIEGLHTWAYWFKTSTLDTIKEDKHKYIDVTFSNKGVGKSQAFKNDDGEILVYNDEGDDFDAAEWFIGELIGEETENTRITPDCMKHIKVDSKVWLHKNPCLSANYGKALKKGDKLTYRRKWSFDTRGTIFYGVKYKGKCLWISEKYSHAVK